MGSSLSKPFESLQVLDILDFVAAMGDKYKDYLKEKEGNGIKGELLAELKDDQDFEDTVLDTLDIKNKLHRRVLLVEWNYRTVCKKQDVDIQFNSRDKANFLGNYDLFYPLYDWCS